MHHYHKRERSRARGDATTNDAVINVIIYSAQQWRRDGGVMGGQLPPGDGITKGGTATEDGLQYFVTSRTATSVTKCRHLPRRK